MRTRHAVVAAAAAAAFSFVPASPASAGGGGGCYGQELTDAVTDEVTMRNACFGPIVARVGVGDTVTFRNEDQMVHWVAGAGGSFGDSTDIAPGDSVEHTFDEAGVFPYYCALHPSMVGAVVVDDALDAAGAAAGGDGGFPAGLAVGAGIVLSAAALAAVRRSIVRSRALSSAG